MKRTHMLNAAHHAHLSKLGVPWLRPPYLRIDEERYQAAYELWKKTRPNASPEWLHMKALGHIAWAEHQKDAQASVALPVKHPDHRLPLWVIAALLFVLAVIFFAPLAHCQFSHINSISTLNGGSPVGFHAAPFRINCNSNMSCSDDGFTFTINSTAAAGSSTFQVNGVATTSQTLLNWQNTTCISVANPSAGNVTFTLTCQTPNNTSAVSHKWFNAYNSATGNFGATEPASTDLADFSTTAPSTAGKIPIYDPTAPNAAGGTGAYVPGDPLVQGTQAPASATEPNPVMGGVWDGANLRALSGDSSGRTNVNINGTVPVSASSLPLPSGAATDATAANPQSTAGTTTAPTKIVIVGGKSSDATPQYQPIPLTNSGAAVKIDGSATTQPVSAASLPLPSGAATSAKQPALGTAGTPSADVISIQGESGMTAVKVDPSAVTSPVSIAATVNVNCTSGCAGGSSTPADTFTNPTTAGLQMTFPMLWNGSTWDRFYGDKTNGAFVNIKNSIALSVNATQTGSWNVGQSGTWTDRIVGNSGVALDAATGAAPPANAILHAGLGSGATGGDLVGVPVADTYKAINISTATTTLLVTGVSGRQVRISALHMIAAGADNVALIEGTGATCGTGSAGMAGGTTAASGYNLAANGGLAFGSGFGTIMQTITAGDSVCAVTSAAVQLSGGLQYTIY